MRWLFADPANSLEMAHRNQVFGAIDAWWRAFQGKTTDLSALFHRKSDWDLVRWMHDYLGAVDPRLMWEYGPARSQDGHRLVITPESHRWLRPVLRSLLERAPKIAGWEFYPNRLPEDVPHTIMTVEARVGTNITGAVVAASLAPARKIDLWFDFPQQKFDEQMARSAAFVASETLMGEYVLDTWIGAISLVSDSPEAKLRPLPMDRAQATVGALVRSIQEQLPLTRLADISIDEPRWSSVQIEPRGEADDYPARADMIYATVLDVEMFRNVQSGLIFTSACHSRCGELFCYIKIDASEVPGNQRVEFRGAIEDELNPALAAAKVGGCIGGGSGLRYSYIDLALTDLNGAVPIIRRVLAERRVPVRTWLLFFDDELSREWIGIHAATPEPPMPAVEE
ncbi:MAG: hypothetical protein L0211_18710 [Planctomycetaceae bacterium]|nr:hypothetical protein [Planctomycetaceae bacterium]